MNTSKGILARVNMNGCMVGGCHVRGREIPIHHQINLWCFFIFHGLLEYEEI